MSIKPASAKIDTGDYRQYDTPWGKLPSVNTVLRELAKPALVSWLQRMILVTVGTNEDLQAILLDELDAVGDARDTLKEVNTRMPRTAANLGTDIHAAIDAFVEDGVKPPAAVAGYVEQARHCLETFELEVVTSEVEVCNPESGYAGTADIFVEFANKAACAELQGCDGFIHVADWKSGSVYPDQCAQLAAYANATHHATGKPFEDDTAICSQHGFIIKVAPRSWAFHVMDLTMGWPLFSAALTAYQWRQESYRSTIKTFSSASPGNGFKRPSDVHGNVAGVEAARVAQRVRQRKGIVLPSDQKFSPATAKKSTTKKVVAPATTPAKPRRTAKS